MLSPGYKSLGTFNVTAAGTYTGDWVEDLDGLLALTAQFRFIYGSGGTSVKAYLQTSIDQGSNPIDIACAVFNTASENAVFNLSGLTPKTSQVTPTDGALADDTAVDGILGDRFRLKIVVVGTYTGSTQLIGSAVAR